MFLRPSNNCRALTPLADTGLVAQNKTIVIVIHDINFASVYSDHIFAMQDGRLVFSGSPTDLMHSERLESIFGFHMPVEQIGEHRLGLYFIA